MARAWLLGEPGQKPCWSWQKSAHHLWFTKAPQHGEQGLGRKSPSFGLQSGSTREPQLPPQLCGLAGKQSRRHVENVLTQPPLPQEDRNPDPEQGPRQERKNLNPVLGEQTPHHENSHHGALAGSSACWEKRAWGEHQYNPLGWKMQGLPRFDLLDRDGGHFVLLT